MAFDKHLHPGRIQSSSSLPSRFQADSKTKRHQNSPEADLKEALLRTIHSSSPHLIHSRFVQLQDTVQGVEILQSLYRPEDS